jgi:hypothetical protein
MIFPRARSLATGVLLSVVASGSGCGDGAGSGRDAGRPGLDDAGLAAVTGGACQVEVAFPPSEGALHVPPCSPVTYRSNPPASGPHYGSWPQFIVYEKPVPWGFLVHALEHGAVVIAHHCSGDCSGDLAQVQALYDAARKRPACPRPALIVTPDPTLDVPFAASAWGATLRAQCFDRERFAAFVERMADRGPELFPDDCGLVNLEASGWCSAAMP